MVINPKLQVFNERILRDNPFDLSQLNGKSVTLLHNREPAYRGDKAWESLAAVDNTDGKIYVLVSREVPE